MGNIYSKTNDTNSNIDSILSTNKWINKMVEPDIGTVFEILCQLHTEQLGIIVASYIVYI